MTTATTFDPERYHVTVSKVEEDGETFYRATVRELPDLAVYGETYAEAYSEALVGIKDLRDAAGALHKTFPEPASDTAPKFNGRVTLRLPSGLHQRAATCADYDGVSLNSWLVAAIAEVVGERRGTLRAKAVTEAAIYSVSQTPIVSFDHQIAHIDLKASNVIYTHPATAPMRGRPLGSHRAARRPVLEARK